MKPIISVEGLGKKYQIKHKGGRGGYRSLREEIFQFPKKLFKGNETCEEFWAVKDVSFDVMPGDRIGIIGRNGAGKSTLLKLLSRITEPSKGKITMRGRVASLLEVGTGFHPELTGRENIFLNGAVLGMTRSEVKRKFDEIVAFAGVEKFLDTPVKRYSSGMYVRLAFSVAAHLEPEILVVDEVLAVGDAEFQKKCLGKMEEVSKGQGRTVLFVSHNMEAIQSLCSSALLIANGKLRILDEAEAVIKEYSSVANTTSSLEKVIASQPADPTIRIKNVEFRQNDTRLYDVFDGACALEVRIDFDVFEKVQGLRIFIDVEDSLGSILLRSFHDSKKTDLETCLEVGRYHSQITIPAIFGPQQYYFRIRAGIHNVRSCLNAEGISCVLTSQSSKNCLGPYLNDKFRAKLSIPFGWKTMKVTNENF